MALTFSLHNVRRAIAGYMGDIGIPPVRADGFLRLVQVYFSGSGHV